MICRRVHLDDDVASKHPFFEVFYAPMAEKKDRPQKIVADNRRARFNYEIGETVEAGIALTGSEVKSLRQGRATIAESYADTRQDEIWLVNSNIPEYLQAGRFNHPPSAPADCCCIAARSTS